jgi:hypothetical protein
MKTKTKCPCEAFKDLTKRFLRISKMNRRLEAENRDLRKAVE